VGVSPPIDSGQSINLTAQPSDGIPPYSYQWYIGPACASAIPGQTSSTYPTGALASTTTYSVQVTDSSTGGEGIVCGGVEVTVDPAFAGTPATISPAVVALDIGQSAALKVSWASAGTPPYSVRLTTGASASCSGQSAFGSENGVAANSTTFTVSPTSTAYFCATVTDSAYPPEGTSTATAAQVVVSGPLSTSGVTLSTWAIDSGQSTLTNVTATVAWSGGTSPFEVALYSGTSAACSSDTTLVAAHGPNPGTGFASSPVAISFRAPASSTYYCAVIVDSATASENATTRAVPFEVNPALTAEVSPSTPTIDSGQSINLTAQPSNGTPPYSYQWYAGPFCNSAMPGKTSQTFSAGALASSATYSVLVTDSSLGVPAARVCLNEVFVNVDPALSVTVSPGASLAADVGQSVTLKAAPVQGTPPYYYQWYTGSSCASGMAIEGATTQSYPTGTLETVGTYSYSVRVTDGSVGTPAASACGSAEVEVNPALASPLVSASPLSVLKGKNSTLSGSFSGGTPAYVCQWLQEAPGGAGYAVLGSSFSCSAGVTLRMPTPALSTTGTWSFELEVADSTGASVTSNAATVSVS
jgi:hypothetical protein